MSSSNLLPRLTALARSWPKDPLRPAEHLQLGQAIQKNLGSVRFDQLTKEETQYADKAISALESIIDGRESREVSPAAKSDPPSTLLTDPSLRPFPAPNRSARPRPKIRSRILPKSQEEHRKGSKRRTNQGLYLCSKGQDLLWCKSKTVPLKSARA